MLFVSRYVAPISKAAAGDVQTLKPDSVSLENGGRIEPTSQKCEHTLALSEAVKNLLSFLGTQQDTNVPHHWTTRGRPMLSF